MAKRKRKKRKVDLAPFAWGLPKRAKSKRKVFNLANWTTTILVTFIIFVAAGIVIGFVYLEKYVKRAVPISQSAAVLELINPPYWVNDQVKQQIYAAATAGGEDLKIDEDIAKSVQKNIETFTSWLDEVSVQTTSDAVRIEGNWRKPLALVMQGPRKFYVGKELVVLDFVTIDALPIVEVTGILPDSQVPPAGKVWEKDDLAAAVEILERLNARDELETEGNSLLFEIDRIDVSNFNGRQNSGSAHIILYTTDDRLIIWGAEIGKTQRYLEATDEQKIARLFSYYKEKGTLLGGVKYIDLKEPQQTIPLPIDRY
jgi:hypothetical protein